MPKLILISLFFVLLFVLMQSFFVEEKKIKFTKKNTYGIFILLSAALLLRILMANIIEGHPGDIGCFKVWSDHIADPKVGPKFFYDNGYFSDYPPLYMLVLYVIGKLKLLLNPINPKLYIILLKLPAMLADIGIASIVYFQGRKELGNKRATALTFIYLICPFILLNSTFWGQIDALFSVVLIGSIYMLYYEKYYMSALLFVLCVLIKPQALIVSPLYICGYFEANMGEFSLIESIKNKDFKALGRYISEYFKRINYKTIGISILIGLATIFIVALPFTKGLNFKWLIDKYAATLKSYPYASVNAFNLYALFGYNWKAITSKFIFFPISFWSNVAILFTVVLSIWFYAKAKGRDKLFFLGYLIIVTLFTVGAKMHERYIFPAIMLLGIAYIYRKDKRLLYLFVAQTVIQFLSNGIVLVDTLNNYARTSPVNVFWCSLLEVLAYIYTIYIMFKVYIPRSKPAVRSPIERENFVAGKMVRVDYIIMAAITLFYGVIAFANLGDTKAPQTFYKTSSSEILLDTGRVENISSMMIYYGIGDSSKNYMITKSIDGKSWSDYKVEPHSSAFSWKEIKAKTNARYFKIKTDQPDMMLGEIGLFDANDNLIKYSSNISEINDEQSLVPKMSSYMNSTYFDEIYHPRTAYEVSHQMTPYENTHPPLGKLIISFGIWLFGMTPFGWRFFGTLTGVLMLPVFYAFSKKLFNNTMIAGVGTFVFAFDFMHFAQTRLATIDSYAVLFILLMYYYLIDYMAMDFNNEPLSKGLKYLALSGLFFGIGAATKWICLYAVVGLPVLLIIAWVRAYNINKKQRKKLQFKSKLIKTMAWCVLFFIIIPIIIYTLSYVPEMSYDLHGRTPIQYILANQKYMFEYHSGIKDTHPFSSRWYEWFIIKRPLWLYCNYDLRDQGIASTLSTFGNPAVWWVGVIAMIMSFFIARKRRGTVYLFFIIPYLTQLLPWVAITRVVFIYHYFACVPFMVMGIMYMISAIKERYHISNKVFYAYCGLVLLLFIMFYPALSGLPVPIKYINYLKWFDSWAFI